MVQKTIEKILSCIEKCVARFPRFYRFLKRCKVQYQRFRYSLLKLSKKDRDLIYNQSFFDKNLEWNIPIASTLVSILIDNFHPSSVVDVGCGNAEFLAEFQKKGIQVQGYEGSQHAIDRARISRNLIEKIDLRTTITPRQTYTIALCLEVAEHIENKFSQLLVRNLTQLSPVIIFTAAPPGQGGHFHINEQPKEFWIKLFRESGFAYNDATTRKVSDEMMIQKVLWWYYQNLMIFRKR